MMATKIEWAEETWNPITGCTKISEGCQHCYAERMAKRLRGRFGYPADEPFRVTLHPDRLEQPLRWRKPRRVFVCSMGDLFHDAVSYGFIDGVMRTIGICHLENRGHKFLILTKRPKRMLHYFTRGMFMLHDRKGQSNHGGWADWNKDEPWSNLWLGVTVENQQRADERILILLQTPAAVRFVSMEPMLGSTDLGRACPCGYYCDESVGHVDHPFWTPGIKPGIGWVIVGGETGPSARPMHPDWVRSIRDQCMEAGVSFFFKQWGEWAPWLSGFNKTTGILVRPDGSIGKPGDGTTGVGMSRVGRKRAGRLLDGREWNEYPSDDRE
jgi:protein gp37